MNDYHKQELLTIMDTWTTGQIDNYITQLEERIRNTRDLIRELSALKKRRTKYTKVKDTGPRSGP